MSGKRLTLAAALNAAVTALETVGTTISLSHGAGMLLYYTVCSNILTLFASGAFTVWAVAAGRKGARRVPPWISFARYISSGCLALTFFTVVLVLAPAAAPYGELPNVLYRGANLYHHLLCPVLSVLSFCFLERERGHKLTTRDNAIALIPTVIYAVILVILNAVRAVEGPYPFLMVYAQPVWASALWFAGILAAEYFLLLAVRKINGRGARERAGYEIYR